MTDQLEEAFGEEFAKGLNSEIQQRREERNKVSVEDRKHIAHKAINENELSTEEPHFTYKSDNGITHDVLLMELPNMDNRHPLSMMNELDGGAVTQPLNYMDEFMSCLFNDPDELKKLNPGDWCLAIGNMSQWEKDTGEMVDQLSPVRGIVPLDEAQEMADEYLSSQGISEPEPDEEETIDVNEEEPEDTTEEETTEDDGGGFLGGGDDEEEEEEDDTPQVSYDDVAGVVEVLSEKDDQVWEVEEGDERLKKLTKVAAKQLDLDTEDPEVLEAVKDHCLARIEEEREDEEEEEEDEEEDTLFGA